MYRNTFYNILGTLIPSLFAIPAMGYIARELNAELFGVFILIFSILGFSSLFDAGITRAVIRKIAISNNREDEGIVMGTSLSIVTLLGCIAAVALILLSSDVTFLLNVNENLRLDTNYSIEIIACTIPAFLTGMTAFGYLEGKQRFYELNIYRIITGIGIAIFPIVGVYINPTLTNAVLGLFIARVLVSIIAIIICIKRIGVCHIHFSVKELKSMLRYGGWITVSNIISPLMVYTDKFILSNMLGAKTAANYTSASELVLRLAFIPASLTRAIFPKFVKNDNTSVKLEKEAYLLLSAALIILLVPIYYYSKEIIAIWLGEEYSENTYGILRVLIIGFLFNSLAQVPFSKIQAIGKSKLTAKIHLCEIFPYFVTLYFCINLFGLIGAAYAWSLRVFLDFLVLEYFSRKI